MEGSDIGEAYNPDDPTVASLLPVTELPNKSTQEQAETKDLTMHNFQIAAAAAFWPKVRSVDSACKLALTISRLMRDRREAAGLRNGPDTGSEGKGSKTWSVD